MTVLRPRCASGFPAIPHDPPQDGADRPGRGSLLTHVPMGSPAMARSMFPSLLKLNTRIGNAFSMHMPMAVMSITLSSSRNTWS